MTNRPFSGKPPVPFCVRIKSLSKVYTSGRCYVDCSERLNGVVIGTMMEHMRVARQARSGFLQLLNIITGGFIAILVLSLPRAINTAQIVVMVLEPTKGFTHLTRARCNARFIRMLKFPQVRFHLIGLQVLTCTVMIFNRGE